MINNNKNNLRYILFPLIFLVFSFCSSEPTQEEIQAQIDAAVELAVEKALSTNLDSSTTSTMPSLDEKCEDPKEIELIKMDEQTYMLEKNPPINNQFQGPYNYIYGPIVDVILTDDFETEQIGILESAYVGINSKTKIFFNGMKLDNYDFQIGEYVVAIYGQEDFEGGAKLEVDHEGGGVTARLALKIFMVDKDPEDEAISGFVNRIIFNESGDPVKIFITEFIDTLVYITSETQYFLNGTKVDSYNFYAEKSEYVLVEHDGIDFSVYPDIKAIAKTIYIVNDQSMSNSLGCKETP